MSSYQQYCRLVRLRRHKSGYTLVESLLAIACLAMIGIPIVGLFARVNLVSTSSTVTLEQTEFAVSILEELDVTKNFVSRTEIYNGRYEIQISFQPETISLENRFSTSLELYRVSIEVDDMQSNVGPFRGEYHLIREKNS